MFALSWLRCGGQLEPSLSVEQRLLYGDCALCVAELLELLELLEPELLEMTALVALTVLTGKGSCSR